MLARLLGEEREFETLSHTRTIGLGGCMFVSSEPLGYGSLMEVLISFRGGVARTDGRVVWERQCGQRQVEIGVEFLRLRPADRKLLKSLFPTAPAA